jgi:hypothetical protein
MRKEQCQSRRFSVLTPAVKRRKASEKRNSYWADLGGIDFTPLDGLFDSILGKAIVPFIVERLLGPNNRSYKGIQGLLAGFTDIPVRQMEIITSNDRLVYCSFANITGQGLHQILLIK